MPVQVSICRVMADLKVKRLYKKLRGHKRNARYNGWPVQENLSRDTLVPLWTQPWRRNCASYIIESHPPLNGALLSSPSLKLAFEPARYKLVLANVMKKIMPSLVQPSGLIASHLSHDQKVVDDYVNDPLVHDRISVSLFLSYLAAASLALGKLQ